MATRSHPESARIIREARQAAGLTQLELAEKLGVTIGTIGYYERGAGMSSPCCKRGKFRLQAA